MKKLLLFLLFAPVIGFGQVLTDILYFDIEQQIPTVRKNSNNLSFFINGDYKTQFAENQNDYLIFQVPVGKFWQIKKYTSIGTYQQTSTQFGLNGNSYYKNNSSSISDFYWISFIDDDDFNNDHIVSFNPDLHDYDIGLISEKFLIDENLFLRGGTKFVFTSHNYFRVIIYEYSFDGNSFSYNEPEAIKNNSITPVLFPNPTSSLLALNSDKEYDIEVYDMAGNKVMALTGNTIDMSHLSSATYIVKALDKVENEEVSYKVVKN